MDARRLPARHFAFFVCAFFLFVYNDIHPYVFMFFFDRIYTTVSYYRTLLVCVMVILKKLNIFNVKKGMVYMQEVTKL